MRHFKLPLIVTGIVFAVTLVLVIVGATLLYRADISDRKKLERSEKLGSGLAVAACVVIAPFWLVASARIGKERREAKNSAR